MHTTHLTQILKVISGIDIDRVNKAREAIELALPVVARAVFPDDIEGQIRRAAASADPQKAAARVADAFGIERDAEFGNDFGMGWFDPENVGPQIQHLLSPTVGLLALDERRGGQEHADVLTALHEALAIARRSDVVMAHDTTPIGILSALRMVDGRSYADTALASERLTEIADSLDEDLDVIDVDAPTIDIEASSVAGAHNGVPSWADDYLRVALEVWRGGDALSAQRYLARTMGLDREVICDIVQGPGRTR